jgi:hypothetical protein
MTEEEWLARAHAVRMVEFLESTASDRKLRLLACASVRLFWEHLKDPTARTLVEVFETYADGQATSIDVLTEWRKVFDIAQSLQEYGPHRTALEVCLDLTRVTVAVTDSTAYRGCRSVVSDVGRIEIYALGAAGIKPGSAAYTTAIRRKVIRGAALVREIFGNPFRPVSFSPEWRTDTAMSLARLMYDSREFGAMPILADALQDAGCDSDDILSHCRDASATHVRGCWVVDLVLNKS